jgi:hypothetical protein
VAKPIPPLSEKTANKARQAPSFRSAAPGWPRPAPGYGVDADIRWNQNPFKRFSRRYRLCRRNICP